MRSIVLVLLVAALAAGFWLGSSANTSKKTPGWHGMPGRIGSARRANGPFSLGAAPGGSLALPR